MPLWFWPATILIDKNREKKYGTCTGETPMTTDRLPRSIVRSGTHYLQLLFVFFCLLIFGCINLYSAGLNTNYWQTHIFHLIPAIIAFVSCSFLIPLPHLNSSAYFLYAGLLTLHVLEFFFGYEAGGSQRWLSVAGLRFQPSEFTKLILIVTTARFLAANRCPAPYRLQDLWPLLAMISVLFLLIFLQPDLGTAGICLVIVCTQLLFVKIDKKSILIAMLSALLAVVTAWKFLLRDYQKLRVLNLLYPELDPHGSGYNSLQSIIAVGSGQLSGKGFLQGSQSQLQFLPARHTDFALAVFAEEHGFISTILVLVLFATFAWIGTLIAAKSRDMFSGLLAIGLTTKIFVEFSINVAMILGIFPVVGSPLPFFSFGGSSLVANSIASGLLIAVDRADTAKRGSQWI